MTPNAISIGNLIETASDNKDDKRCEHLICRKVYPIRKLARVLERSGENRSEF